MNRIPPKEMAKIFVKIIRKQHPDPNYFSRFPDSDLATVSVNLLKGH
jgi:hypothetical protein